MKKKRVEQVSHKPERKTRKDLRKEQRQLKKQAKCRYFDMKRNKLKQVKHNPTQDSPKSNSELKGNSIKNKVKLGIVNSEEINHVMHMKLPHNEVPLKQSHEKLLNKMKNQRKRQLLDANKDEEKEIKYLEKRLKLDNKKTVSTTKGFVDSGLDYILDVCDPERIRDSLSGEVNFEDSDSDFYEDYTLIQNKNISSEGELTKDKSSTLYASEKISDLSVGEKGNKKVQFNLNDSMLSDSGDEPKESSEFESGSENSDDSDKEENETSISSNVQSCDKEVWEDIYGRLRDKKGNILELNKGKYIPPHLRGLGQSSGSAKQREIIRLLKGLLNRLALNNMHSIANQVEELFLKHSRNSVNEALFNLFVDSIVLPILSPERLVIDHAMLIAILHGNVGSEIGAFMLQNLVDKFSALSAIEQPVENKELDNLLLLISYLYNFKVFEACLMYDILTKLCVQLTEKNVDLILVVLKHVGFSLRKDDPLAMKGFLLSVQKEVNQTADVEDCSRMKYMLEVLLNIKNNNVSKLSDFDPSHHEHLKKVLKSVLRSGNSIVALRIGLDDLLKVEERGRWWLVGSAWSKSDVPEKVKKENVPLEQFSAQLLALARKQKMNTDNRRNLFCILMSAEDYQDAFEKILKLGLKGQQEREIPLVIVHCLLQEKNYNPYYAHVADQLCTSNRRHQMSLQCALWDRFRALEKLSSSQICLLAKFLAQLLVAGSLAISVLKVVEFTELDKRHIRLLRQTILSIVKEEAIDSMKQVFERVSKSKKLSLFREALRLFIHHFILRNMPDGELKERVLLINSILSGDIN